MRALAKFIMRGRVEAIGSIVSLALLSHIIPPLVFFTTAGIALVTLVQGYREGLTTLIIATIIMTVFTGLALGQAAVGMELAIKFWVPAWFLASTVLYVSSLSLAIVVAAALSSVMILGIYIFTDPAAQWYELINKQLLPLLKKAGLKVQEGPEAEATWLFLSSIMTGSAIAMLFAIQTMSLLLARWWQVLLYNPSGLSQEFHQLRFGVVAASVALIISLVAITTKNEIALNLILIVIVVMMFQGLAVIHRLVAKCKVGSAWLVGAYMIMLFTLLNGAIGVLLVAGIGLIDNWFNFRFRLCATKTQNDMS